MLYYIFLIMFALFTTLKKSVCMLFKNSHQTNDVDAPIQHPHSSHQTGDADTDAPIQHPHSSHQTGDADTDAPIRRSHSSHQTGENKLCLQHNCKTFHSKPAMPYIDLGNESENIKKYLHDIILPDLANIIFSYLSYSWYYKESHTKNNYSGSYIGCAIVNDEIMCIRRYYIAPPSAHEIITSSGCYFHVIKRSTVCNLFYDNSCVYIVLDDVISVVHCDTNEVHRIDIEVLSKDCPALCIKKDAFVKSIKYIKNDVFYITTDYFYKNTRVVSSLDKKYSVKNIKLYINYAHPIHYLSSSYLDHNSFNCKIMSILVNDVGEIFVVHEISYQIIKSIFKTEFLDGMYITFCSSFYNTKLLYCDNDEIFYVQNNYLIHQNKITNVQYTQRLGSGLLQPEPNIYCACLNRNMLCMFTDDRMDVYVS